MPEFDISRYEGATIRPCPVKSSEPSDPATDKARETLANGFEEAKLAVETGQLSSHRFLVTSAAEPGVVWIVPRYGRVAMDKLNEEGQSTTDRYWTLAEAPAILQQMAQDAREGYFDFGIRTASRKLSEGKKRANERRRQEAANESTEDAEALAA